MGKNIYALFLAVFLFACRNDADRHNRPPNDVIVAWNKFAVTIADQHDQFYSFIGCRALAMTHLAMHDALQAISPKFSPYTFNGNEPKADPIAACCQAAFVVLANIYPTRIDTLQKELEQWLSSVPEGDAKNSGVKLGQRSAEAILQLRKDDGHELNADYHPRNEPGAYQFTPGFTTVWNPDLSHNRPFALQSASQFRVGAPPALNSEIYARDLNEVKAFGVANSKARTIDQTNYAHWWAEFGEHGWNRIGRITAVQRKLPLYETARLFALINMTLYDVYLASCDSKYIYDRWRPITAIHHADIDSNAATDADTSWKPEMVTVPLPEYPSAHAAVGAAEAAIVSHIYGTREIAFEMESVTALPEGKTRSYPNLDSAVNDCATSRIMNGYHFRFSTEAGKAQGRKVAEYIFTSQLQPLTEK